jgi:hypothetical protein
LPAKFKCNCPDLFPDDLDEDAVGEFAFEQVDYAVFDIAFEDLARGLFWT